MHFIIPIPSITTLKQQWSYIERHNINHQYQTTVLYKTSNKNICIIEINPKNLLIEPNNQQIILFYSLHIEAIYMIIKTRS